MNAQEIIDYIANSEKKTPVKLYVNTTGPGGLRLRQGLRRAGRQLHRLWRLERAGAPFWRPTPDKITDYVVENDRRNSGVPLLDLKDVKARIEPGAIIREKVEIGEGAVIMMGAVINIGAVIGKGTMIDMGAVLGGRAIVGERLPHRRRHRAGRRGGARLRHPGGRGGRRAHRRQRRGHRRRPDRAGTPWWPPAPWSLRMSRPTPWWPAAPPGS